MAELSGDHDPFRPAHRQAGRAEDSFAAQVLAAHVPPPSKFHRWVTWSAVLSWLAPPILVPAVVVMTRAGLQQANYATFVPMAVVVACCGVGGFVAFIAAAVKRRYWVLAQGLVGSLISFGVLAFLGLSLLFQLGYHGARMQHEEAMLTPPPSRPGRGTAEVAPGPGPWDVVQLPAGEPVDVEATDANVPLLGTPSMVEDVQVTPLDLPARVFSGPMLWSGDGDRLYLLRKDGRVQMVTYPDFQLRRELKLG